MTALTFERLRKAVGEDAAIRRVRRLQPAGGPGDKMFPPTYPGEGRNPSPRHVFERRRIGGQNVLCVLVDSVQSQANRLEEALKAARQDGKVSFPAITVDFAGTEVADIGRITTLGCAAPRVRRHHPGFGTQRRPLQGDRGRQTACRGQVPERPRGL